MKTICAFAELRNACFVGGVFVLLCCISPSASRAQTNCTPAPNGLVAWWPADGFTSDVMGTNSGTAQGSMSYAAGEVGQAFSFSGPAAFVSLPNNCFPFPTAGTARQAFSFEVWFKTSSGGVILGQQSGPVNASLNGFVPALYVGTDGKLRAAMFWSGSVSVLATPGSVTNGSFHHTAVSYDGTNQVLYLDGAAVATNHPVQTAYATSYFYQFGTGYTQSWPGGNGGWYQFTGLLDEPSLYSRALSASEIASIYAAGSSGKCFSSGPSPVFVQQPMTRSGFAGLGLTLYGAATGTPRPVYQWFADGLALSGQTEPVLSLDNLTTNDGGNYTLVASNVFGSATSTVATVTVAEVPQTGGWRDTFESYTVGTAPASPWQPDGNGAVVDGTVSVSGTNSLKLPGVIGGDWEAIAWRQVPVVQSMLVQFSVMPSSDHQQGCCHTLAAGAGLGTTESWRTAAFHGLMQFDLRSHNILAGDYGSVIDTGWQFDRWYKISILHEKVNGNVQDTLWVDGVESGTTTRKADPHEDLFQYLILDSGDGTTWVDDVSVAVLPAPPTNGVVVSGTVISGCDGSPVAGASVNIGSYSTMTDGSGAYSISNILSGTYVATVSRSNYFTVETDNLTIPTSQSAVTWSVDLYPTADIVSQPQAQSVSLGATATFTVLTKCSGHETYQWQFSGTNLADNARIVGSHTALLSISNVQPSDAGYYSVTVKPDDFWTNESLAAELTVIGPPLVSITAPKNGDSFGAGSNILVAAAASETGGEIKMVAFFLSGTNMLGSVAVPPYEVVWSNAPAGTNLQISAVATDGFGLSATSSVLITVTNTPVAPPPGPPIVAIISPTNGATFQLGAKIPVTASASETNGLIRQVSFALNSSIALGAANSSPYGILCTNAPVGTDSLTAVATDVYGISATSTIQIVVTPVAVPPSFACGPDITVAQGAGVQSFAHWATSINQGTPGGTLTFTVTPDNPGLFSVLPALASDGTLSFSPAADATGVTKCQVGLKCTDGLSGPKTNFNITVVAPGDVAIVLATSDADPGPVTNDVSTVTLHGEQSLSYQLFPRSQLNSAALSLFKLIIWYDPEGTQPVTQSEVSQLQNLYSNNLPLIFLGPRLLSGGAGVLEEWQTLLHLQADGSLTQSGTVAPALSTSSTLLPSGVYGQIEPFTLTSPVDRATVAPDSDSDGQLGTNDVLASFPSASDSSGQNQTRTFSMLMPLEDGGDAQSVKMRNQILQNAICWALNCGVCPEVYLTFVSDVQPQPLQTGQPATIALTLGNMGRCDGAVYLATVDLAPGLRLDSVSADLGQLTTSNNEVRISMNRIPPQDLHLTMVVTATAPGWLTNAVHQQTAPTNTYDTQVSFQVVGNRIPQLAIQPSGPRAVLLSAWAQPGISYVLERAILQSSAGTFMWTPLTNFIFADPVFQMQDVVQPANSGFLYRVRSRQSFGD